MNRDRVEGKFDQVAGKVKQGAGEAVGNQRMANAGAAQQIEGTAKETWGKAKDTADVVHEDNRARVRAESENKAHNMRDNATTTAQNMKNKINEKLDDVKREHRR